MNLCCLKYWATPLVPKRKIHRKNNETRLSRLVQLALLERTAPAEACSALTSSALISVRRQFCALYSQIWSQAWDLESRDTRNSSTGNTLLELFAIISLGAEMKLLANRATHQMDPALTLVFEEQRVDRGKWQGLADRVTHWGSWEVISWLVNAALYTIHWDLKLHAVESQDHK